MNDQLKQQKDIAQSHLQSSWPIIKEQAQTLPSFGDVDHIVICGCGDSHHAAIGLSMGFSKLTRARCWPAHSMNASRYVLGQLQGQAEGVLLIAISASGEVARTIEATEIANQVGARTLAFTGDPRGSLAQAAQNSIAYAGPSLPHGPGLISYLSSLLMGYAIIQRMSEPGLKAKLDRALRLLSDEMGEWVAIRWQEGERFANKPESGTCIFLGSGPIYGSALFGAAKVLEASGEFAWGQDVEEWAHLEYFCAHAPMRTWLLSANGRSISRESEIRDAAHAIGRSWHEDRWSLLENESNELNEILSPLVLWAGPSGYASRRSEIQNEVPFRNFGGGRDRKEGGGPSRIRSSVRSLTFGESA